MTKVRITQVKSGIGYPKNQKSYLEGFRIKKNACES